MRIESESMAIWPHGEGEPDYDDLTPDGKFAYLNEQVIWIAHRDMPESRSALRVPEFVAWEGKKRVEVSMAERHNYQDGQIWQERDGKIVMEDTPISYFLGESPGKISCEIEFLNPECISVVFCISNASEQTLEKANAHYCLNHRRAPLLGRNAWVMTSQGWQDFDNYHAGKGPYRVFNIQGNDNPSDLPIVTEPFLLSECALPQGNLISAIGSNSVEALTRNVQWPCTDVRLAYGDIPAGETVSRQLLVSVTKGSRDDALAMMKTNLQS